MKIIFVSALVSIGLATSAAASTLTAQFSSFAVFGDSLSDNGNLFGTTGLPPAPYSAGRFSNGPVWNEAIGAEFPGGMSNPVLGQAPTAAVNLAFGGSRADGDPNENGPIPSLTDQLGAFLLSGATFQPDTLVSVWAGANDIFQDLDAGDDGADVGMETAADVNAALTAFVASGARNLLVFNLPDFGAIPRYSGSPLNAEASNAITSFNAALETSLDGLDDAIPDLSIYRVDVYSIFADIIGDPGAFGFANVDNACITIPACVHGDQATQDSFLFWDNVHPTAATHRLIETAARQALAPAPVPLPAGAALLVFSLFALGMVSRRRA